MFKQLKKGYEVAILYRNWEKCKPFKPMHVELLVSSKCNLRCKMCNVWKLILRKPDLIKEELTTIEIVDFYEELQKLGTSSICLSGGEPLLRDDITILIEEAKKRGFFVELITNGTKVCEKSYDLVNSGLDSIIFSIDSPTPEIHDKIRGIKGTWVDAIQGIKSISNERIKQNKLKPRIIINYIITRINYEYMLDMFNLKQEIGYDIINFLPLIRKATATDNLYLRREDLENISTLMRKNTTLMNLYHYTDKECLNSLCFAPWTMTTLWRHYSICLKI